MLSADWSFAEGMFRVIAPDLRRALGGQSDAPQEVEGYGITNSIVKDVAGEICLDAQPSFHRHVLQAMQPCEKPPVFYFVLTKHPSISRLGGALTAYMLPSHVNV